MIRAPIAFERTCAVTTIILLSVLGLAPGVSVAQDLGQADIDAFDHSSLGPWSDVERTTLTVPRVANGSVQLDGSPSSSEYGNFEAVEVVPILNAWVLNFPPDRVWDGPEDSSFRFWLAHDDTHFYVAADVTDDVVNADDPNESNWKDDSIELQFDALNDKYDVTANNNSPYGGHDGISWDGSQRAWDPDAGAPSGFGETHFATDVDWTYGADGDVFAVGAKTDNGYAVEARYNKRLFEDPSAGNKLQDGYVMGFNITVDDDDARGVGPNGSGERDLDEEVSYYWAQRERLLGWDSFAAEAYSAAEIAAGAHEADFDREFTPGGRLTHGANGDIIFSSVGGADIKPALRAGDADQDLDFDQIDLVKVQIAAKYLTGQPATWGDGDWDGAPGGEQGSPPAGDGLFDQLDIIAALGAGHYLSGPYAAVQAGGQVGDAQTSVIYNAGTGEVQVDAPAGIELTSINIDSAGGIFTSQAAQNLGGSFDNDADGNIFKATFGGSFGSVSFGNVAQADLSQEFVLNDLTVVGSLAGGGDLGAVDLVYVPEPTSVLWLVVGLAIGLLHFSRAGSHRPIAPVS